MNFFSGFLKAVGGLLCVAAPSSLMFVVFDQAPLSKVIPFTLVLVTVGLTTFVIGDKVKKRSRPALKAALAAAIVHCIFWSWNLVRIFHSLGTFGIMINLLLAVTFGCAAIFFMDQLEEID